LVGSSEAVITSYNHLVGRAEAVITAYNHLVGGDKEVIEGNLEGNIFHINIM